jgi:hypothetical protein
MRGPSAKTREVKVTWKPKEPKQLEDQTWKGKKKK